MLGENEKIDVLFGYLPHRKVLGNTDHEYMENFKALEKVDSNVNVSFNRHLEPIPKPFFGRL